MAQLYGKVIAISGAGSGIGLATACECGERGAILSLSDINAELLDKIVTELKTKGLKVKGTVLDVSHSQAVDAWVADTVKEFGRLDGAANVAGVETSPGQQRFVKITDISNEHWDFVNKINLTGTFYALRAEVKAMLSTGGSIVNVSSVAGLIGQYGLGSYVASKHGVIGLSKTAAREFGANGVRVNVLAPGSIDTPMLDRLRSDESGHDRPASVKPTLPPLHRWGTPSDMAKTICFMLSNDSAFTTGAVFAADGGQVC